MQGPLKGQFLHRVCLSVWPPIHRGALNRRQAIFRLLQEAQDPSRLPVYERYASGSGLRDEDACRRSIDQCLQPPSLGLRLLLHLPALHDVTKPLSNGVE